MKKEETYFHANNIIQTEEVVFMHSRMYLYLYICIFIYQQLMEKEAMKLKDITKRYMKGFGGRKG